MKNEKFDRKKMPQIVDRLRVEGRMPATEHVKKLLLNVLDRMAKDKTPLPFRKGATMKKWSIIIRMKGSDTWYRNGQRFDTFQDAEEYGHHQYVTHGEISEWHAVLAPEGDAGGQE